MIVHYIDNLDAKVAGVKEYMMENMEDGTWTPFTGSMNRVFIKPRKVSMEIRRVFVDKLKIKNNLVLITGPMQNYISSVLRKNTGDRIDIIDGKGYLYRCTVNSIKVRKYSSRYLMLFIVLKKSDPKSRSV